MAIIDREEQAKIEVGNTKIAKRTSVIMSCFFIFCIFLLPIVQGIFEVWNFASGGTNTFLPSITTIYSTGYQSINRFIKNDTSLFANIMDTNEYLLEGIIDFEDELENNSIFREAVIPVSQQLFTGIFKLGNEKAVIGKDGWLFYEPGLHYLMRAGKGNTLNVNRSSSKANTIFQEKKISPSRAIIDFSRQLNDRGIQLILVPAPVKPMFFPNKLSSRIPNQSGYLQNPAFYKLKEELEENNIIVFDVADFLNSKKDLLKNPLFLRTDTHWSPEAVSLVADELAIIIDENIELSPYSRNYNRLNLVGKNISNTGDIANMLSLSEKNEIMKPEEVLIRQVLQNENEPWVSDRNAEILFLGDSFSNIYSQVSMGWGESAGIVEHLSYTIKRPVDRIIQNDNGAYATRQSLQYELSRGRDRLEGKKVVIWEFAVREIVLGDWKRLEMQLNEPLPTEFFIPEEGSSVTVSGIILEMSSRPVPKTTPYKDHIMTFHIVDAVVEGSNDQVNVIAYAFSMKNYELTDIAHYRPGQKITLRLQNWFDVSEEYNSINRSEIDNDELLFEDPCWVSEVIK